MEAEILEKLDILIKQTKACGIPPPGNSAAQILLAIVPILGIIFGTGALIVFMLWRYRIINRMIANGSYRPMFWANIRLLSLLIGSISMSVGIPMTIVFAVINGFDYTLLGGVIPFATGLGFLMFYFLSPQSGED